jgi:23S rRNA pseudouridine1911/1915/1917 synthase
LEKGRSFEKPLCRPPDFFLKVPIVKSWIAGETAGFLVVNKPAGVLSQKDKSGENDLAAILRKSLQEAGCPLPFLAPIHRLDRNTSGLILMAKSSEWARQLTTWLQEGRIQRTYLAIVKGDPGPKGSFQDRLKKNERTNTVSVDPLGDEAITEYERLQKLGNSCLMRVQLKTGRSHQIRVHFSHAGHALLGDKKYAKKPWSEIFQRPALHSATLSLPGGPGNTIAFSAELPDDMAKLLLKLGGTAP